MKKLPAFRITIITLLAVVGLVMTGCQENPSGPEDPKKNDTTTQTPSELTITSFSPRSARIGRTVRIEGKGFVANGEKLTVHFPEHYGYYVNGVITDINDTILEVIVPITAKSGQLKVTRGGMSAMSADTFEVIPTYYVQLQMEGITGVCFDSTVMQSSQKLDTIEQHLEFNIRAEPGVVFRPGGIDTIIFGKAYTDSFGDAVYSDGRVAFDSSTRRITWMRWKESTSGTDKKDPGHMDDEIFSRSWTLTLRDIPYVIEPGRMIARIPASMLSKEMIEYEWLSSRSATGTNSVYYRRLLGLGDPRAGGTITVTILIE